MANWILKTEPEEYSWDQLVRDKQTLWTGIRNFQARNNLRAMQPGDLAFIYHSGEERMIYGIAEIIAEAVPEPTADKGEWLAVEIKALKPLVRQVGLDEIKNTPILSQMALARQGRLSVSPVTDAEAKLILKIAKTDVS